jgi:hypothetical protein
MFYLLQQLLEQQVYKNIKQFLLEVQQVAAEHGLDFQLKKLSQTGPDDTGHDFAFIAVAKDGNNPAPFYATFKHWTKQAQGYLGGNNGPYQIGQIIDIELFKYHDGDLYNPKSYKSSSSVLGSNATVAGFISLLGDHV